MFKRVANSLWHSDFCSELLHEVFQSLLNKLWAPIPVRGISLKPYNLEYKHMFLLRFSISGNITKNLKNIPLVLRLMSNCQNKIYFYTSDSWKYMNSTSKIFSPAEFSVHLKRVISTTLCLLSNNLWLMSGMGGMAT